MKPDDLTLYLVTDPSFVGQRNLQDVCKQALSSGVRMLQLRDKTASTRSLVEQARALETLTKQFGATFLVNDRVDVAMAAGADGVHLGQDDMSLSDARRLMGKDAIIGISVQTPEEARQAEKGGANYLAANMVFATPTKTDLQMNIGLEGIRRLRQASTLPMVAIGGIKAENATQVVTAGADGVAVVSAIMLAPDLTAACQELLAAVTEGRRVRHG